MINESKNKSFFTASDLIKMSLPELPLTPQGINKKANKERWEKQRRKGRGGGWEYSVESLPANARMEIINRNLSTQKADETAPPKDSSRFKTWQIEVADRHFKIVQEFLKIIKNVPAKKRTAFGNNFSKAHNISYSTLKNKVSAYLEGGYQALIPNWNSGRHEPVITHEMKKFIEKNYLQPYGPPIKKVYEDLLKAFTDKVQRFPTYRTVAHFIDKKWTRAQQLLIRDKDEYNRLYDPFVRRDWSKVELNETYISDHKQLDIACLWRGKLIFPWLTVVEEALSRKFVGWVLVPTPNSLAIGQAFLYAVSKYGAPKTFYVDCGRDFRSQYIAGKKEKRDSNGDLIDPALPGLLARLGTEIFYAVGRNPREKIIEAAFGIFTDRLKDLPGYRGHSTKTRPKKLDQEIKTKNLVVFEELSAKIDDLLNERNARPHSTTGKSPDSYWEGYQAKIPSQEMLDFLLMDVSEATVKDSSVLIKGLLYRGDELFKLAGERVEVRRDPKDIRRAVIIYHDKVFCSATLETPDHYRSEITLQSVKDAQRIRKKIKQYRKEILETEDYIDDPLSLAVELDHKEKIRMRDIRPAESKVISINRDERLARDVAKTMQKSEPEKDDPQEAKTAIAGGDILSRYLAATAGHSRPIGRID
ncbi:MAG: Mu transposase C-terminal domain-containing protein [Deltaproteobacteria bacterium]